MKLKRLGFLRHYRKIKIEGTNLSNIINKSMKKNISMRNIKWNNPLESSMEVKGEDYDRLKKTAGHSYKLTTVKEGGILPFISNMKDNMPAVIGAFLLGAFLFYQSLFVAEIRIDGYKSIGEADLRKAISRAGLYEGVKKKGDYTEVKAALYREFENITWVSIFEKGRLIEVDIAEASKEKYAEIPDETPVDIVAAKAGIIDSVTPLKGDSCVNKGDYVNKGDVLIKGTFEYQSSDYSKGDKVFKMYSHAEGQAFAKAPEHFTYYIEKKERTGKQTGSFIPGIYIKIGDLEIDTSSRANKYEASQRKENVLVDSVKLLPVKIAFVRIEEVEISEKRRDLKDVKHVVEAAVRQYVREHMTKGEKVVSQDIDYSESEGLIKADVLLEIFEDIGVEKEIKRKDKEEKARVQ